MNSLDSEPPFSGCGSEGGGFLPMGDCMMGGADPLLSQDPHSVHNTYNSLADEEVSNDFPEEELMPSSSLYSLYLLHPNSDSKTSPKQNHDFNQCGSKESELRCSTNGRASDSEENIDVLSVDSQSQSTPNSNGLDHDALFEGMPFYELKGREVGPCAYCMMWRAIRFLSYCGNYPFCSVACTKKFAVYKREKGELLEKTTGDLGTNQHLNKVPTLFEEHKPQPLFPPRFNNHKHSRSSSVTNSIPNGQMTNGHSSEVFDWSDYLQAHDTEAAPVKCFCHAPMSQDWKGNLIGAMIEVHNRDPEESPNSFWVARVIQMAGYKVRLRFEGYGMDSSHDFTLHLLMAECYSVNGAVKAGHIMKPPKGVLARLGNGWQEHLARVAHAGSPTIVLPQNKDYLICKFKTGMHLEAVYKQQISHTIVATVTETVANRIHVQYDDCKDLSKDFWFHETSPWIHPVGWSQRVGHPIISTAAYKSEALDKGRNQKAGEDDAPWDLFNMPSSREETQFRIGMKLEVVDPLRLGTVCVATVMQVLREGYLMIGVDGCLEDTNSWFCCHSTSPALLPVGFCEYHNIDLQPPRGSDSNFDWVDYLRMTESVSAPIEIFHQKTVDRGFKVGHKLEAVDLIESGFICVATVTKVAGPLLRIHFDGWDRSFDQWMDCDSPDICPVGWCEMVSYPLQPPRIHESQDYISITPVCKPISRRKHYPSAEKRRMFLTPALEKMSRHTSDEAQKMMPSVYSFSDEESNHERTIIPPPPKKQLIKKPQNRTNLKLKMSKTTLKHNGKGRPYEAASHHNYALPSSREGNSNAPGQQPQDNKAEPEKSVPPEQTLGVKTGSMLNGFLKSENMEKGEFIVEVEKGIVGNHSKADASISSLDSPPLSADSSSGSIGAGASHQSEQSESRGDPEGPGKFTMRNWSHVEHKQCTKMLSSRPFKDFGKEKNDEFGIETYDFEDASMAPPVLIPSVNKHEKKKKKKKKKKNKKKKDKEKNKDDEEPEKEKHKKEGKKKKSKLDKERKKERRKEKEKAKAKASQLSTLLNLPTELPSVMQTDMASNEENVLNHILNDKSTPPGGLDLNRMSKVKFSMNTGSNPETSKDTSVSEDNRTASDKVSTLDRLLAKSVDESVSGRVAPYTVYSQTLKSDSSALTSLPVGSSTKPLESQAKDSNTSRESKPSVGFSSFANKDIGKPNVPKTNSFIDKTKSRDLTLKERLSKELQSPSDDPYNFEAELNEEVPVRPIKEKKASASNSRKDTMKGSSAKNGTVLKSGPDTAALLASQAQVQKIIKDVNTSLASQEHSKPVTVSKEQVGKKGPASLPTSRGGRTQISEEDELKLKQLRSLFLQQEKISDILTKQQAKRKRRVSSEEQSGIALMNAQGITQVGFLNSLDGSTTPNLPSPQQQEIIRMMMQGQTQRSHIPPSSLPLGPDLASPSQLSPSSNPGVFTGFRPTGRDLCNMVALSRPPKEFCMPVNVRSPSPTAMMQGLTHPPRMSPTSIPLSSPTSMSPTISRPPPTYRAHLSQALRNMPRSPVDPRSDFLPFPPQHRMPIDSSFPMPHPHANAPQRLPPLQSLLMQPRYPPPPHPKKSAYPAQANHSLGSPQMSGVPPPTHILAPPPPSVPPPPYNLHQAMVNQQSPLPSPLGRQAPSSSTSSPQMSPATPGEPALTTEQPTTPNVKSPGEKMPNPWTWGIPEVVQFLAETGEGSCAECFCRQNINGQKLMSLTKEQLVKLTGMKVAPSLKIYEQIVKLRSRFPIGPSPQSDSMSR
ncbi:uncharacterized protein LOC121413942 [Lytechinus variegatus]|uniref:uncharacterized protein LOC121413942 n=1 Tax=Lytechinus variegatus TaxID=7654 RepID=UPI001BB2C713|nr:uncharacterized protein LOC121413942 [Lytechinus variegatus]